MKPSSLRTDVRHHRRGLQTEYELEEQHRRRAQLLGLSTVVGVLAVLATVLYHLVQKQSL